MRFRFPYDLLIEIVHQLFLKLAIETTDIWWYKGYAISLRLFYWW